MNKRERDFKLVVIGGGTGISVLLKGLKKHTSDLTAVVTVSDDGGSSGRLRTELGVLPPGDIRNCLVALAETETLMDKVFQHRFKTAGSLNGHNMGNLLLVAMAEITGDFISAIKEVSKILAVRGRVIPATLEHVILGACMEDGRTVFGETAIRNYKGRIKQVFLVPSTCEPVPDTLQAINEADAVILGPGSLYTSIIPNLLVKEIKEAIKETKAVTFYISNIMTESGETDDYTAADHVKVIIEHLGEQLIDYVIVNSGSIGEYRLKRYKEEGAVPVKADKDRIEKLGIKVIEADLVADDELAWHDPDKLAAIIIDVLKSVV
ncbi:YvcK family protein [Thermosyntropha sp.]|uniref:gluconeogenesis factor YvcK family protein n=1 Tax=Thermosyntropha sp. TaxID=2740820 RepID=UPI0025DB5BC2|nr:YvcK family protein [Thermosyntropha sp.]MBO8159006.1 YvcK family protein [Thermosyntropha sp.]